MQTIDRKIIFTLFVIGCLWLSGCGSDHYGGDYTTDVVFDDSAGAGDETMTLDMWQNPDCDGDATTTDPEEFYDAVAIISVSVADFAPGLTINGYTIEYLPELSADGTGAMVMPPTLNSLTDQGSYNIYLASNSENTFTITCFSIMQKWEFDTLNTAGLGVARYTIRIILMCTDDNGEGHNLEVRRTVYFGYYDNC